jgi:glycosyltransferase involved in cell wall biosynthesis
LLLVRALSIGGCERDLTKMAIALDRSRFEPHVACFQLDGPRYPELKAAGIPVTALPVRSFASLSAIAGARAMGRYIRSHGIRVVHCFDVPTDLFAAPVARLYRVPVVLTSQLSYRDLYPRSLRPLLRFTDRISDQVVVNSEALKRHMIHDEHAAPDSVVVCHNGVDTTVFHGRNRMRVSEVRNASLVIGAVCVLRAEKRLDLVLESFARVRHCRPGMKLMIVGSGDRLPDLEALRDRLGIGSDCIFIPAQEQVADWMRSIDVFIMSSESESFPNALLEAMACECCVIGSRVGGIPELVTDGVNGLLFASRDLDSLTEKLALVINNEGLRKELTTAAGNTARETFSMHSAARRTEALYTRLLARRGIIP